MAIQQVDLKVPNGDTPRSANTKINANFSDQTNAASRLVGIDTGQVPLSEQVLRASLKTIPIFSYRAGDAVLDCDLFEIGDKRLISKTITANSPQGDDPSYIVTTEFTHAGNYRYQYARGYTKPIAYMRVFQKEWSAWVPMTPVTSTYTTTTAAGANVVVDDTGKLMRSTSSERYKDILAPLELDDARYADAMALKPIVYRSTADADNPAYHYYSFSAEELGAYDPAFTLWRETEMVTDADGNVTEQALAERQAEGININALLAIGHAIAIKQDSLIKILQDQVGDLQSAVATLQATNNP